jgi:LPXTG-site transpeptidase (sortase) family protein
LASGPSPSTTSKPRSADASRKRTGTGSDGLDGPYTLRIPEIGVAAPVVSIRTNEDRVLNPPRDPDVVGWWSEGAAPGRSTGSAVLVGHTVRNKGGGVFDNIGDLSTGDVVEVSGSDSALTYRVSSVDVLSKDQVARDAEKIFAQNGDGRLVIITCDDWDGVAWRSNIVTVAAPA